MLKVGLTGGIGCGKTTVSLLFSKLGVPIIDADEISRELVKPNKLGLIKIEEIFGKSFLLKNGELNKIALKTHIFEKPSAKQNLEAILHPLIFQEIDQQLASLNTSYCIISIPLLFETHSQSRVHRVLVIDCDESTQILRVQQRDKLPLETIQAIMANQVSQQFRKLHANDLLSNDKNNNTLLAEEVKKLHNFYLSLSYGQDSLSP